MVKQRPKKSLGQNFLKSKVIGNKIVDALGIKKGDTVVEIGPGRGLLTDIILERYPHGEITFIVVEKDRSLIPSLQSRNSESWFKVINDDILLCDLHAFSGKQGKKLKVIGNIPYNITSDIIFTLVQNRSFIDTVVLTLQKEVADRIAAAPGSKVYGRLSVMVQLYASPESLFIIKPEAFYPVPKVSSKVIKLVFNDNICFTVEDDERLFARLVRQAFSSRRKTLVNNLKGSLNGADDMLSLQSFLTVRTLKPTVRAEELSVGDFVALTRLFIDLGCRLHAPRIRIQGKKNK